MGMTFIGTYEATITVAKVAKRVNDYEHTTEETTRDTVGSMTVTGKSSDEVLGKISKLIEAGVI